ncbi:DUF6458 family protein [Arsenicicoccus dermatophilus]|uniref:DUF6458 family protein n=1 Tax=Arsenicicoccus dermatophilus TaxID=1076331 RepID=UPI0039175241
MGIGLGIFLLVVGAILRFAVADPIQGVDLQMIGTILMVAGALSLVLALIMQNARRHTTHETLVEHRDTGLPRERY